MTRAPPPGRQRLEAVRRLHRARQRQRRDQPGERFGLIGPNGSGKTTLINCISGALRNDTGTIVFAGEEIGKLPAYVRLRRGIARSFQIPRPFKQHDRAREPAGRRSTSAATASRRPRRRWTRSA